MVLYLMFASLLVGSSALFSDSCDMSYRGTVPLFGIPYRGIGKVLVGVSLRFIRRAFAIFAPAASEVEPFGGQCAGILEIN